MGTLVDFGRKLDSFPRSTVVSSIASKVIEIQRLVPAYQPPPALQVVSQAQAVLDRVGPGAGVFPYTNSHRFLRLRIGIRRLQSIAAGVFAVLNRVREHLWAGLEEWAARQRQENATDLSTRYSAKERIAAAAAATRLAMRFATDHPPPRIASLAPTTAPRKVRGPNPAGRPDLLAVRGVLAVH